MTNNSADLQMIFEHNAPGFNELIIQMDDCVLDINGLLNQIEQEADGNAEMTELLDELELAKNDLFNQSQNIADKAERYAKLAKQLTGAAVEERDKALEDLADLQTALETVDTSHDDISNLYETVEQWTVDSWEEMRYYQSVEQLEDRLMSSADAQALAHFIDGVDGLFEEAAHYLPALKRLVLLLEMEADGNVQDE